MGTLSAIVPSNKVTAKATPESSMHALFGFCPGVSHRYLPKSDP